MIAVIVFAVLLCIVIASTWRDDDEPLRDLTTADLARLQHLANREEAMDRHPTSGDPDPPGVNE